ncbi:MAG: hypothetical protein LQ352_005548 [Teloschistes flavicans]|nr:MAG: hypothetical protein LQ352_005548 [Teloschistes flavicans]
MAALRPNFAPVRACLFDMDGLLLNTEDMYTLCNNVILREHNRPNLPWNIKAQLQGRPGPEAGEIFHAWAQLPISRTEYMRRITELQRQHFPSAQPLPGVPELLKTLSESGVHLALATSSHTANYHLKTSHLNSLFKYFPDDQKVLGDDTRIPPGKGKPAPDIYLLALETINSRLRKQGKKEIKREECLVFEDSVPGVEAGRRAGMRVVWCPHPQLLKEYKGREKEVLAGLANGGKDDQVKEVMHEAAVGGEGKGRGWPGRRDDGWAELHRSLESFPYSRYGIRNV